MGVKGVIAKVQNNMIGSIAGAGIGYYATRRYNVSGTWKVVGITLLGVIAGAYAQSMIQAKKSAPTSKDIKK